MYLDLDIVKSHLNVDYKDDDVYIMSLIDVAEEAVKVHLCRPSLSINGNIPSPIKQACLLMIGTLYNQRETVTEGRIYKVPLAYEYLLSLYQKYD